MLQDFRRALRRVGRAPGSSIALVLIVGVGVAGVTTMASVLSALAFTPLTLPEAPALVSVSSLDKEKLRRNTPLPALERLRAADLAATGWCAYNSIIEATESGGRVLQSSGEVMAGDCTAAIGLQPVMGRWFTSEETPLTGSGKPVMVITERYWQRMFDGSPDVLGRSVKIENISVVVIGVMPERYTGFSRDVAADYILPFNAHRTSSGPFMFIGRLTDGASIEQLQTELRTMWPSVLEAALPAGATRAATLAETTVGAESLSHGNSVLRRLYAVPIQRLAILSGILLLLVATNVGGLMESRVAWRTPEIAAMRALGADSWRIARPLAAECTIVAAAGSLVGIPVAYIASGAFASLLPIGNVPWTMTTTPDAKVIAIGAAGVFAIAMVIAALPIWLAVRTRPQLRSDRTISASTRRWAQGMLVLQIAVTVVLVFSSGLIVQSFSGLRNVERGYDREHLLSVRLAANPAGYQGMDAVLYYRSLIDEISALPGVRTAGIARYFGTINTTTFGQPVGLSDSSDDTTNGMVEYISPGFFGAAGVPLLSGRDVQWTDLADTPKIAIVSESLARSIAPDGNVIGRVIRHGTSPATARLRIVGVAGNLSMGNPRQPDPRMVYLSSLQLQETRFGTIHINTAGPPLQLANAAAAAVAKLGREHVRSVHASDVLFTNSVVAERMGAVVSGGAAIVALIISCIGVFALMSHGVERRRREIGIRIAIGATPATVSRAVVRDSLVLVVTGVVIGIPAAIGAASLVRSLLFGVTETDARTIAISAALLLTTSVIASVLPAARAVRVDPAQALRSE